MGGHCQSTSCDPRAQGPKENKAAGEKCRARATLRTPDGGRCPKRTKGEWVEWHGTVPQARISECQERSPPWLPHIAIRARTYTHAHMRTSTHTQARTCAHARAHIYTRARSCSHCTCAASSGVHGPSLPLLPGPASAVPADSGPAACPQPPPAAAGNAHVPRAAAAGFGQDKHSACEVTQDIVPRGVALSLS